VDAEDGFGGPLAGVGDLNGDTVPDLVAGVPGDDDGGANRGAIWLLYLNKDGTLSQSKKVSSLTGLPVPVYDNDYFGSGVASLNGKYTIAVGVPGNDDGGLNRGTIWLLSLE
jgi:hypothetical protein